MLDPMKRVFALLLLLATAREILADRTPFVHLEGDRLTVNASQAPLRTILAALARANVDVRMDPSIDVLVTGSCRNAPVEEALDALLENYSYVTFWDVIPGPLGDLARLSELQVFSQGHRQAARPLPNESENFIVTRAPSGGPAFVADELLLTVRAGVSAEEFRNLLAQIGGTVVGSVPQLGVYRILLPPGSNVTDLVAQLARNPLRQSVEPNYVHQLPSPALIGDVAASSSATAPAAAAGAPRLAVLDSGLLPGSGAEGNVVGRFDALDPTRSLSDPAGHGTQMALIAAGAVQPSGASDSSEGVPIVAIRTFDANGQTSNFALMRALTYAMDQGARVINLSWGSETDSGFVANAIAYAQSRGAVVVAAAGNEPTGHTIYPAAYQGVVAVAALDASGKPWASSNYGSFVDVAAPGTATMPVGYQGPAGSYAGTSIASAYVARELALYLNRHPTATSAQAIAALYQSLSPGQTNYGSGTLDSSALSRFK